MTGKYTPGPWEWVKPEHYPNHNDHEVWLGGFRAGDTEIMDFGSNVAYYPTEGEPPSEANARLIAAAPDLLEALKRILSTDGCPANIIHEAIAKAEGRA